MKEQRSEMMGSEKAKEKELKEAINTVNELSRKFQMFQVAPPTV